MEIAKLTYPSLKGIKLNGGTCLNKRISEEEKNQIDNEMPKQPKYDVLELMETGENQKPLCTQEIKIEGPQEFRKISYETMKSFDNMIHSSIELASKKHITGEERIGFLKECVVNWANDKKENDEEMFAMYVKFSKSKIEEGKVHLTGLPSDFTMEDYHYYVDKWEGIWEQQRNEWNAFFKRNHTT